MSPTRSPKLEKPATKQWEVRDFDRILGVAENWEQLEQILLSAPKRAYSPNTIVDVISPGGDTLSIGVAGPSDHDNPGLSESLACLNFVNASRDPPYLTAVGDASLDYETGGVVVFKYEDGTWTEILRRNCVPTEKMIQIVRQFFTTGSLPAWVDWEQV